MKFLDTKKKPIGNPHQILNLAPKTTQEVRKAEVKAKLITRTYTLQSDKAKFTKNQENEICPLCHSDTRGYLAFSTDLSIIEISKRYTLISTPVYLSGNFTQSMGHSQRIFV
jgi:hypothetical protein